MKSEKALIFKTLDFEMREIMKFVDVTTLGLEIDDYMSIFMALANVEIWNWHLVENFIVVEIFATKENWK